MVQIKRDWFDTALENYERGETYGRWTQLLERMKRHGTDKKKLV